LDLVNKNVSDESKLAGLTQKRQKNGSELAGLDVFGLLGRDSRQYFFLGAVAQLERRLGITVQCCRLKWQTGNRADVACRLDSQNGGQLLAVGTSFPFQEAKSFCLSWKKLIGVGWGAREMPCLAACDWS